MANLNLHGNLSDNEKLLLRAKEDLILFGKLFSPQDFLASATPDFHVEVGKHLIDPKIQQLGLVLPRDHAKSTLAATAILYRFLFAAHPAVLYRVKISCFLYLFSEVLPELYQIPILLLYDHFCTNE